MDAAVAEVLARQVELMVKELHEEEAHLEREPPEGQEVRFLLGGEASARGPLAFFASFFFSRTPTIQNAYSEFLFPSFSPFPLPSFKIGACVL